jgi:hypothetical protein
MNKFKKDDYIKSSSFKGIALYVIGNTEIEVLCDHEPVMYESYCPYCNGEENLPTITCDEIYDCVMVGDDQVYRLEESEMELISEDEFCGGCGQIGCGWH